MADAIGSERDQTLLAPVLEHLVDAVACGQRTLQGYGLLQGLVKRELRIQALEDTVVLALLGADGSEVAPVVARFVGLLQPVAEVEEVVVEQVVGHDVKQGEHLLGLLLEEEIDPQVRLLLEAHLGTTQPVLLDERFEHPGQPEGGGDALRVDAATEALTGQHAVIVLERLLADDLKPQAGTLFELGQTDRTLQEG